MDSSNTIQALLKAEQNAKMIVDQARQERKAQLKRAQLEANEEIIAAKDAATKEVSYSIRVQTKAPQTKAPQTKAPILHSHKRPNTKRFANFSPDIIASN